MKPTLALLSGALALLAGTADLQAQGQPASLPALTEPAPLQIAVPATQTALPATAAIWPPGDSKSCGNAIQPSGTTLTMAVVTTPPVPLAAPPGSAKSYLIAPYRSPSYGPESSAQLQSLSLPVPSSAPSAPVSFPGILKTSGTAPTGGAGASSTPMAPSVTAPVVGPTVLGGPALASPDPNSLSGVMGGAAFYLFRPYLQNNIAYRTTITPGSPQSGVVDTSFQWRYQPATAFWLGYTSPSGLGVQARYFGFDQASPNSSISNSNTPQPQAINPPPGFLPPSTGGTLVGSPGTLLNTGVGTDQLTIGSDLKINAVDLAATYAWQGNGWSLLASAGARYLTLDQGYHFRLLNTGGATGANELQLFDSNRSFSAGGVVFGLLGRVQVGRTGLALFGSIRGSELVGTDQEHVAFAQLVHDPVGLGPGGTSLTRYIAPTATRSTDHTMSVAEVELGVEYGFDLRRSNVFFRAGVANHTYFDAGNTSQSTGNLSLFGLLLSAGVNY